MLTSLMSKRRQAFNRLVILCMSEFVLMCVVGSSWKESAMILMHNLMNSADAMTDKGE